MTYLILILCVVLAFLPQVPVWARIAGCAFLILLLLFLRRAQLLYVSAGRKIASGKGDMEKNWKKMDKAVALGLPRKFLVIAANLYIQKGDAEKGMAILEKILKEKPADPKAAADISQAKSVHSMGLWLRGDLEGAIAEMKEVYDAGSRERNMYVNYTTYLLEAGEVDHAAALLAEASSENTHSQGLYDNDGWVAMLKGDWSGAQKTYEALVAEKPLFAEPYVHLAQIRIHEGRVKDAIGLLSQTESCRFTRTSGMHPEIIKEMKDRLADPATRMQEALSIDASLAAVAAGKAPVPVEGTFAKTDADVLPGFAEIEDTAPEPREKDSEDEESEAEGKEERTDDAEPDTDITEEDEEYIRSHGLS